MDPASITNHILRPQKIEKVTMAQQDPPIEEPRYRVSRNTFITKEIK